MKISVITVCRNTENTIRNTIESVLNQTYNNIEHIIIDGKSTDKTFDIVQQYKEKIAYCISETDTGLYNAMNKAINIATGDILFFLNSGDEFYDENVLQDIANAFDQTNAPVVYGNILYLNKKTSSSTIEKNKDVDNFFFVSKNICHQAIFYKAEVFKKCGLYNEGYKILADYDFNIRAFVVNKLKFKYIDRTIAKFELGGISTSENPIYQEKISVEQKEISEKYFKSYQIYVAKKFWKSFRSLAKIAFIRKIVGIFLGLF